MSNFRNLTSGKHLHDIAWHSILPLKISVEIIPRNNRTFLIQNTNALCMLCAITLCSFIAHPYDSMDEKPIINNGKNNTVIGNMYKSRAYLLLFSGQHCECIQHCNKALSLQPNDEEILAIRGAAKSNLQDFGGALDDFKKSAELGNIESKKHYDDIFASLKSAENL